MVLRQSSELSVVLRSILSSKFRLARSLGWYPQIPLAPLLGLVLVGGVGGISSNTGGQVVPEGPLILRLSDMV